MHLGALIFLPEQFRGHKSPRMQHVIVYQENMVRLRNKIFIRIFLTCVQRAHNSISFLEKVLLRIKKILTTFSILNKNFLKTDLLTKPFL